MPVGIFFSFFTPTQRLQPLHSTYFEIKALLAFSLWPKTSSVCGTGRKTVIIIVSLFLTLSSFSTFAHMVFSFVMNVFADLTSPTASISLSFLPMDFLLFFLRLQHSNWIIFTLYDGSELSEHHSKDAAWYEVEWEKRWRGWSNKKLILWKISWNFGKLWKASVVCMLKSCRNFFMNFNIPFPSHSILIWFYFLIFFPSQKKKKYSSTAHRTHKHLISDGILHVISQFLCLTLQSGNKWQITRARTGGRSWNDSRWHHSFPSAASSLYTCLLCGHLRHFIRFWNAAKATRHDAKMNYFFPLLL